MQMSFITKTKVNTRKLLTMGKINKDLLNSVSHGDVKSLKTLINRHGLHNSVAHGYILLLKSIKLKNNEITELLLNEGSRVNRKRNKRMPSNTPLHLAIENGDLKLTEMLLDNGADINANNVNGLSPLVLAISKKKEEIIDLIIRKRSDCINDRCKEGICPLHAAAEHGLSHVIQKLLQNGANVDVKTAAECTALQYVCRKGNLEIIELLLNNNANINPRTHHTWAPLYLAIDNCHVDAAKLLMIRGANINNKSKNGKTVLSCAIEKCLWLVEDILKYSPDINNASNKKSFKFAARHKNEFYYTIVKSLIRYGFSVEPTDINDTALLRNAIKMGYIKIIQDLIKHGLDLTYNKSTFLLIAVKNKQLELAELFVAHGADVNSTNNDGRPLIFYSVQNSDVNMYKLLVQHGADVNEYPELLRLAIKGECKEIFDHLLENKVDIDAADEYGRTPLHFTVSRILSYDMNFPKNDTELDEAIGEYNSYQPNIKIRTEIAKILLDKGVNIHAKTYINRSTALHIACEEGFANLVEILLEYQADVNCVSVDGTPLHCAAGNRHDSQCIIEILLANKANINSKNENGDTALHIALQNNNTYIVETLVKNGADIDSKNNMYVTPLHKAITYNSFEAIYILLEHGCSINSKDIDGNTPLHQAIISGNCLLKRLLEFGSDINILNNNNQTPVDIAYDRVEKNERYFEGDDGYYGYYEDLQYEPDESYEDNRDMKNFKKLLLHAIMLKAANLYYGEIDLYSYSYLRDKNFMKLHEEKCTKEIIQLKLEKIAGTKFSFYDILTKNTQSTVSFAKNEDVVLIFQSDDYEKKFPIYGSMLKRNFLKATQRNRLLETAHEFFKCLHFEIPYGCADQILNYLSDSDLQNLFKLMKMHSTFKT
ncbi:putative ankyrin repeat protein RF_0381 [Episyrphus balteatus]|uniref:putative ankyrin repeat protein RF_0381 n=1 Tax=Episyrphus balteatus TaxID=286459 RepID=UPI00248603D2|nr:putative ankyrin repeat protein RF_0381 [Episyrphus balteatus]